MLEIIFFLLVFLGIYLYKSKFIYISLLMYIFVIVALNSYNPDYRSYVEIYKNPMIAQEEIGFRLLCQLGNYFGWSYDMFHGIVASISLFFYIYGIRLFLLETRLKKNISNFYLVSYMLFPMAVDVVLLRSFIAASIIIYSLHFLYKDKIVVYIIINLLASTIHISSLFFLLFVVKKILESKKIKIKWKTKKKLLTISIIIIIIVIIIGLETSILKEILILIGGNVTKIDLWLSGRNITINKIIFFIFLNCTNYFTYVVASHLYIKDNKIRNNDKITRFFFIINTIFLINTLLLIYSEQFIRLLGVGIIINSIYYSIILTKKKKSWFLKVIFIFPALLLFVYKMFVYSTETGVIYYDYIFKCILENNFLLKLFL